ncbi:hypothetical protein AB834_06020 [PVC group bacterium (ex Bugula neritina AB1)]|nr:hypothetical protein AB834_06020 [PVC group bacterium (ex Bugula neritina AB1)]
MDYELKKFSGNRVDNIDFLNLDFGRTFSDHMIQIHYKGGKWSDAQIKPFENLSFSPSMLSLHYGQTVFEGVKAFFTESSGINVFRIKDHLNRLNRSAARMCIPEISPQGLLAMISDCLSLDKSWVPKERGSSLYIRPFIFATDAGIGLRPSSEYMFIMFTCPVDSYYKKSRPLRLLCFGDEYIRCAKGGTGEAKTAGNYAASLLPTKIAEEKGFDQVLWLDGKSSRYIDEIGTMNIFFVRGDTLITPVLSGSVLDGITRRSVITLAKDLGWKVEEKPLAIEEIQKDIRSGEIHECFGSGTAVGISSVGSIQYGEHELKIENHNQESLAQKVRESLLDIQHGAVEDLYGWNFLIP